MSNSPLANYIDRSNANYSMRTDRIQCIMIHSSFKKGTCRELSDLMASFNTGVHYGVDINGTIGLFVDEDRDANGCENANINAQCVHIMVMNSGKSPMYSISNATYQALVKLCADVCRRNFIRKLTYDRSGTLKAHVWYQSITSLSTCPGPYMLSRMDKLASDVNALIEKTQLAESQEESELSKNNIVVSATSPYMATLSPNAQVSTELCREMKSRGVVGVNIYAGTYFNEFRQVRATYENANIKEQEAAVSKAKLPYAIYTYGRAQSVKEVGKELDGLYYVLAKYPPKLGVWVRLQLPGNNINTNNNIVKEYYNYFYKWGLHDKCGIYCTQQELNKITWDKFCDYMSLWLIRHESDLSGLSTLLVPEYFKHS